MDMILFINYFFSEDDSEKGIAISYGNTVLNFLIFGNHKFDLVLCLGDRFEMSAAVQASIPFWLNWHHSWRRNYI